jgi:uncharacterized protein YukE
MGKAHVDPGELRRFARDLSRFGEEIQQLTMGLRAKMRDLQKSWRDQQQQRFSDEFEKTVKTLRSFSEASQRHVLFLQQQAGHIEEYLRQR